MKGSHSLSVIGFGITSVVFALSISGGAQTPTAPPSSSTDVALRDAFVGKDSQSVGCSTSDTKSASTMDFKKGLWDMVSAKVPEQVILSAMQGRVGVLDFTPSQIAELKAAGATDKILSNLVDGSEVYIGWSVVPSKIVRDNYGRYVMNKYFAMDVVVANRSKETDGQGQSLIVTALEFCHDDLRDVSIDPALVRGSLQKGELTGRRNTVSHAIQAIGDIASPSSAFFKNALHRGTFSAAAALFTPLKTGFDLVAPDTILTYLENWDKDEVFKKGFVVPSGGSTRGRIFIPIELIYPRPLNKKDNDDDYNQWIQATKGNYDPEEIKRSVGTLVVLGQQITLGERRRYMKSGSN